MHSRGRDLVHVHSHVENRKKDRSTWLPCEWGNYLADKIAADNHQALTAYDTTWLQLSVSQILTDIGNDSQWLITSRSGLPSLAALEQTVLTVYKNDYLLERDHWHAKRLDLSTNPPASRWRDATVNFAARVWDFPDKSLMMVARAQRVIFDKLWFSWNLAKSDPDAEVICPLCEGADSLGHLVQACPDPVCAGIREDGLEEIKALTHSLRPEAKWMVDTLIDLARYHPLGHLLYSGMWNHDLRMSLYTRILKAGYALDETAQKIWRSVLDDVSHSLVLISRALVSNRIAGPSGAAGDTDIGDRIQVERLKRTKDVQARRLKRIAALKKKKAKAEAEVCGSTLPLTPESSGEILEALLDLENSDCFTCNLVFPT